MRHIRISPLGRYGVGLNGRRLVLMLALIPSAGNDSGNAVEYPSLLANNNKMKLEGRMQVAFS